MAVSVMPAGNYAGVLGGSFRHAEIHYAGSPGVLDLPDGASVLLTEFGVLVRTPDISPNRFIPWGSIAEIVECAEPRGDDGQVHD